MKKVILTVLLGVFFSGIIVSCTPDNLNEDTELATDLQATTPENSHGPGIPPEGPPDNGDE